MASFFTSDEHYFHKNVIRLCGRPFESMEEMHEELISRHNFKVGVRDTVYHLGDFVWSPAHLRSILERLNGRHILIKGNHDQCHSCHKKHEKMSQRYLDSGFFSLYEETFYTIGGRLCKLNHFPYYNEDATEHYEMRYKDWRPIKGPEQVLLRGHSHSKSHEKVKWHGGKLMIDVGVDGNNYYPYSKEELEELIRVSLNERPV